MNFGEHRLQLLPDQQRRSYARAEVEVHERLDGSLAVVLRGQVPAHNDGPRGSSRVAGTPRASSCSSSRFAYPAPTHIRRVSSPGSSRARSEAAASTKESPSSVPGPHHPWRKPLLKPKQAPVSPACQLRHSFSNTLLSFFSIRCKKNEAMRRAKLSRRVPFQGALTGPASMADFAPPDEKKLAIKTRGDTFTEHLVRHLSLNIDSCVKLATHIGCMN